jgi:diphthamide synthase (EF-2-diphthine--ammonia ligase)
MAFGDIYLEDVRQYREEKLKGSGITPLFPIWGQTARDIAQGLISSGFEAYVTSLNPNSVPDRLIGHKYDLDFLKQLPPSVDPCGENGEFHTFVTNGPVFKKQLEVEIGEIVNRDGFLYADILPKTIQPSLG